MSKVAIITGASTGIGKSLSRKLTIVGYKVILVARSLDKLKLISEEITEIGGDSLAVKADLSTIDGIKILKEKANAFGRVTLVVNNVGFGKFNTIEDTTLDDWDLHMNINLRASFLVSKTFLPAMKKIGMGSLVFINSVAGKKGYSNSSAYVASKYGLRGLADSLREELRLYNIKVISIFPGAVNTPFWDSMNVNFPRNEMLDVNNLSESILHAIQAPDNVTIEEMIIRRTAGDF